MWTLICALYTGLPSWVTKNETEQGPIAPSMTGTSCAGVGVATAGVGVACASVPLCAEAAASARNRNNRQKRVRFKVSSSGELKMEWHDRAFAKRVSIHRRRKRHGADKISANIMMSKYRAYACSTWLLILFVSCAALAQSTPTPNGKTIAERLGYPAKSRLLIIHADDFGMMHTVD